MIGAGTGVGDCESRPYQASHPDSYVKIAPVPGESVWGINQSFSFYSVKPHNLKEN